MAQEVAQQFAFAEHPDHPFAGIHDRQAAQPGSEHIEYGATKRRIGADGTRAFRHEVPNAELRRQYNVVKRRERCDCGVGINCFESADGADLFSGLGFGA